LLILSPLLVTSFLLPVRLPAQKNDQDQTGAAKAGQDDKAAQEARQAAGLDLEQLANMSMNVTSVTRKSEALFEAPAAIFVLTSEDIRRGGFTTLPEALRMVPGLYVAQITPHDWNISARGFTDVANDKMLVLVDGRSAYTPLHGGVNWDTIDLPLEDIDRIEVIRGPGGTLWGANAVNGVINIVTKSSKETQGTTVSTTADVQEGYTNLTQYGGRAGDTFTYRAFGKSSYFEPLTSASGIGLPDRSRMFRGGVRTDWEPSKKDSITLEGGTYDGRFLETPLGSSIDTIALSKGSDVAMRWKHSVSDRSRFDVSGYCDWYTRGGVAAEMRNTCAVEFQHDYDFSKRSSLIWGASFLSAADVTQSVVPGHRRDETASGFLQYEFVLVPERLRILAGSKFEHNGFSGFEYQPQARAVWTPNKANAFWAAISRAVRVPSRTEDDLLVTVVLPAPSQNPVALSFTGSEELRSERLKAYETGYRYEAGKKASVDLSVFYNDYSRLITADITGIEVLPTMTVIRSSLVNGGAAQTHGAELSMNWRPVHRWTLSSGITELRGSSIATAASPAHIFTIQSRLDLPRHIEFDSALYHASALRPLSNVLSVVPTQGVDTLNRVDAGLSWRPARQWLMSVQGRNLQSNRHRESPDATFAGAAGEVPRSVTIKITWQSKPAETSSH